MTSHIDSAPAMEKVKRLPSQRKLPIHIISILVKSPVGLIGALIISMVVILAIIGPAISPHDPVDANLRARFQPPGYTDSSGVYILGTDQLGRDILSRIIAGTRVSVLVGIVSVLIAGTIGVIYGLLSGFVGGLLDTIFTQIMVAILSIPFIVLVVAISGVVGGGVAWRVEFAWE